MWTVIAQDRSSMFEHGEMTQWYRTCHTSMRTGIQIPKTCLTASIGARRTCQSTVIPVLRGQRHGLLWACWIARVDNKRSSGFSERDCSVNRVESDQEKTPDINFWTPWVHLCACVPPYTHVPPNMWMHMHTTHTQIPSKIISHILMEEGGAKRHPFPYLTLKWSHIVHTCSRDHPSSMF